MPRDFWRKCTKPTISAPAASAAASVSGVESPQILTERHAGLLHGRRTKIPRLCVGGGEEWPRPGRANRFAALRLPALAQGAAMLTLRSQVKKPPRKTPTTTAAISTMNSGASIAPAAVDENGSKDTVTACLFATARARPMTASGRRIALPKSVSSAISRLDQECSAQRAAHISHRNGSERFDSLHNRR